MGVKKKSQISVIEMAVVLGLFGAFSIYFGSLVEVNQVDYQFQIDSLLDSIYYSEDYRSVIMSEDLTSSELSQDWDEIINFIEEDVENFEIVVGNLSNEKIVTFCTGVYHKSFSEKVISIEDNDNFEFRKIRIGVCY